MYVLIQAAEQAWYACPLQICLTRGCPNEQNIAHQTREQKKCFRAWTNDKCLAAKHHQTLFGDQIFCRLDTLFGAV